MSGELHIDLLGGFRLEYKGEQATAVNTPRLQELLAWLLLYREAPQSRQHLAFLFWPDSTEPQARNNLRQLLYNLRNALPEADRYLIATNKILQWNSDAPFTLDITEFETVLDATEKAKKLEDSSWQESSLKEAISLYRGPLLPDCYAEWIEQPRDRLHQTYITTLGELVDLLERKRDYKEAIRYARLLIKSEPYHEPSWRRLIQLCALDNDRAGALQAYRDCVTVLREELDIEPTLETQKLYERLVAGYRTPIDIKPVKERPLQVEEWPLVGRQPEWEFIQEAWERALAGDIQCLILKGEPGIGKTRLGLEFSARLRRQGYGAAYSRCYEAAGSLSYGPVIDWLKEKSFRNQLRGLESVWMTELMRLMPELLIEHPDLTLPGPVTEPWQQRRLFEAIARGVTAGDKARLLFVDDLQWCDAETLEWISYLFHNSRENKLMLIGAYRPAEASSNDYLQRLLEVLRRQEWLQELSLGALSEEETGKLASSVAKRSIEEDTASRLYRETEGHPLFVVEAVRGGRWMDVPDSETDASGEVGTIVHPLPKKVNQAISARFRRLSKPARQLMGLAAVIGREFTLEILKQASGLKGPELIETLEELLGQHIIREQSSGEYDFTHDKLREVAYGELSEARKRWLHEQVAGAIEEVYAGNLHVYNGRLAWHYDRAGKTEKAVSHYEQAAEEARTLLADLEAVGYLNRSSAQLEPFPKTAKETPLKSIAVLPLENQLDNPEQEYIADGITEELINELGKNPLLRVIAPTSVMEYKSTSKSLQKISRELNVGAIVKGSVRLSGENIQIEIKLLDPVLETTLWSGQYDCRMTDLLAVQEEIVQTIIQQANVTQEQPYDATRLIDKRTVNPAAHEAYLKGRHHLNKPMPVELRKAIECFQEAVEIDPEYALAYSGMGIAYNYLGWLGGITRDVYPKAKQAAKKALELDETLAEPHAVLGYTATHYDWDWKAAERELKRAIELNPNYAEAYLYYSWYLYSQGEAEKSRVAITKAGELDPLSLVVHANRSNYYEMIRDFDSMIQQTQRTLELAPDYTLGLLFSAWAYCGKGLFEKAVVQLNRLIGIAGPAFKGYLAYAHANSGNRDRALKIVEEMKVQAEHEHLPSLQFAIAYIGLQEFDQAFTWLDKAYEERAAPIFPYIRQMTFFDSLRDKLLFQTLLDKLNFPKPVEIPTVR